MAGARTGSAQGNGDTAPVVKGLLGSNYARSKKALTATINEIRSTGAAVDVDLPTIAVAGNQSSGKSSLIEAISGINLPRAVGTCTRVPTEVRLRQDNVDWNCVIRVRREGSGSEQLGILNPSVPLERFVIYQFPDEEELRPLGSDKQYAFSKDVIVLEITGPDQTDLTLVDLPGIIQNVGEHEDKNNIMLIESMVKSYIEKDCLILLVITMKDDIQNQKAALLAREADPEGKRTIGVLTKVDTLQGQRETEQWLKVVQNQKEKLAHGYYVTRQPDADALAAGISFADAREQEDTFFHDQAPWKGLDRQLKKRLGTRNLAAFLSDQLSSFIKTRLPELEKQIGNRHREIEVELQKLGEAPSDDPTGALLALLTRFESSISRHIEGQPDYESLIQETNVLWDDFVYEIDNTEPQFVQVERPEQNGDKEMVGRDALEYAMAHPDVKMYLDDKRLHIDGELPNQLPPSALQKLIKRSTSTWEESALGVLEEVKPVIKVLLDDLTEEIFGKFSYGGLPGSVNTIVNDQLATLFRNTRIQIEKLVAMERRPFTLNTQYLNATRTKSLAQSKPLKRKREDDDAPATTALPSSEAARAAEEKRIASRGVVPVATIGILPTEKNQEKLQLALEYEAEIDLMADTLAYWLVAYKRFIDNIPRCIDLEYFAPLSDTIRQALINELKVFGEDAQARCREYLDEAPDVSEHRKDLAVRRARLGEAKVAIRKFKMK